MELVVRKNDLLRELQLFQGIVERKNTMPVLANVLLRADGDQVELVATDLDVVNGSDLSGKVCVITGCGAAMLADVRELAPDHIFTKPLNVEGLLYALRADASLEQSA